MLIKAFDLSLQQIEQELGQITEGAKYALTVVKAQFENYAHQIEEMREKDTKVFYEVFITDQDRKEMAVEREGQEIRRVLDFDPSKSRNRK
jgi:phosphopantetheine adenylyltransferase